MAAISVHDADAADNNNFYVNYTTKLILFSFICLVADAFFVVIFFFFFQ